MPTLNEWMIALNTPRSITVESSPALLASIQAKQKKENARLQAKGRGLDFSDDWVPEVETAQEGRFAFILGMANRKGTPYLELWWSSRRGDGHRDGAGLGADPVVKLTAPAALRPGGGRRVVECRRCTRRK